MLSALNESKDLPGFEDCPAGPLSTPYVPGFAQWVVAVGVGPGVPVGVCVTVGELLAVADGLGVTWPVGADDGWPGVADGVAAAEGAGVGEGAAGLGVAAGWLRAAAATSAGSADGPAAAIMIPATIAAMPPMPPAASNTGIQEE